MDTDEFIIGACPCKRDDCPRYGDCAVCRAHHAELKGKRLVACERLAQKRGLTKVYFVRHCQSLKGWQQADAIRPLTAQGAADAALVAEALKDTRLDYCACSPYVRSLDTIRACASSHGLQIHTDERFGERIGGQGNDENALIRRWAQRDWCEPGGECISSVQARNLEGLKELLNAHRGESILFGTHGTALATMLDYYGGDFGLEGFNRIYRLMPCIVLAVFDGQKCLTRKAIFYVDRGY